MIFFSLFALPMPLFEHAYVPRGENDMTTHYCLVLKVTTWITLYLYHSAQFGGLSIPVSGLGRDFIDVTFRTLRV